MKKWITTLFVILLFSTIQAQSTFKISNIHSENSKEAAMYAAPEGTLGMRPLKTSPGFSGTRNETLYGYKLYPSPQVFFSFSTSDPDNFTTLATGVTTNEVSGGEYFEGSVYLATYTLDGSSQLPAGILKVSATSWTVESTLPTIPSAVIFDMAYDYSTSTMYAISYNSSSSSLLHTVNLTTGALTTVGTINTAAMLGLACSTDGTLYGLSFSGILYTINKSTAATTLIGSTGEYPGSYYQSMAYDHNSEKLFWMYTDDYDDILFEVNIATGSVTDLGGSAEMAALHVPYIHNFSVPSAVTNFIATPASDNSLYCDLAWTNPSLSLDGDPLTSLTTITVKRDGTTIHSINTPVVGGDVTWRDNAVPSSGNYTYSVYATNAEGDGPIASATVWVGLDPCIITLPITMGFESDEIDFLGCWSAGSMNSVNVLGVTTDAAYNGERSWLFSSYSSASNYNQYLFTPELPTAAEDIYFSFYYMKPSSYGSESFRVGYSTTDDLLSSFTWFSNVTDAAYQTWKLHGVILPAETKYVAINYNSNYSYYLTVDDISIDLASNAPRHLVSNTPAVNATNVNVGATVSAIFDLDITAIDLTGITITPDPGGVSASVSEATLTIAHNDFDFFTEYTVTIPANSIETVTEDITWTFTTEQCAVTPSNIQVTELTANGGNIDLSWTSNGGAQNWIVEYKMSAHSDWYIIPTTTTSLTLSNIQSNTAYNIRVKAVCSAEDQSEYATHFFVTPCMNGEFSEDITIYEVPAEGTPTSTTNNIPFNVYFGYGYSQQIFDADIIQGGSGDIYSISFYSTRSVSGAGNNKMWLANTNKTTFTGSTDYVSPDELTLVYESSANWNIVAGWNTITLDVPFTYTGGNLLLAFYEGRSGDGGSSTAFQTKSRTGIKALYQYNDTQSSVNPNSPATSTASKYTFAGVNFVQIGKKDFECNDTELCPAPTSLVGIPQSNGTSIELSWTNGGEETAWKVYYKTVEGESWTSIDANSNPYTLTLPRNFTYDIKVKANCASFSESDFSNTIQFFSATCYAPVNLAATNSGLSTTLTWEAPSTGATSYIVEYKKAADEDWISAGVVSALTYTFPLLDHNTSYNFIVKSYCGVDDISLPANLTFTTITCAATPSNIQVTELTSNGGSVTVTWDPQGAELNWVVEYKLSDRDDWYTKTVINNPTVQLSPIQSGSIYNVRIKAVCAEGYESNYATATFSTTCFNSEIVEDQIAYSPMSGTYTTNNYIPLHMNWRHTYSQQIHSPTMIEGGAGEIKEIAFEMTSTNTSSSYTGNIQIWLGHTSKISFNSNTDWIPTEEMTLVYSSTDLYSFASGWNNFVLDNPFFYNGGENLVIAFVENYTSTTYDGTRYFRSQTTTDNSSIYYYVDGTTPINVQSPPSASNRLSQVNYVRFKKDNTECYDPEICPTPEIVSSLLIDDQSEQITWTSTGATTWSFCYREKGETEWNEISVSNNPYTLTDLELNVYYEVRVKSICGEYNESYYSNIFEFLHAKCFAPINFTHENDGLYTTVSWEPVGGDAWEVQYKKSTDSEWGASIYTNTGENSFTFYNLASETVYNIRVRTICEDDFMSLFGEYTFTTRVCEETASNLSASEITTTSALLNWDISNPDGVVELRYSIDGMTTWTTVTLTGNSYLLSNLTAETTVNWQVRFICDEASFGDWVSSQFVTAAPSCSSGFSLPFTEGFDDPTFPPTCWTSYNVDGGGSQWVRNTSSSFRYAGAGSAGHSYSSAGDQIGWLVTPKITLPETGIATLEFYSYNNFAADNEYSGILVSTTGNDPTTAEFTEIKQLSGTSEVSASFKKISISLESYAGQDVYIGFKYTGNNADAWYIDELSINSPSATCATPTTPVFSQDADQLTISWSPVTDVTQYELQYRKTTETTWTTVTVSEASSTITIIEEDAYQARVRSICETDLFSDYSPIATQIKQRQIYVYHLPEGNGLVDPQGELTYNEGDIIPITITRPQGNKFSYIANKAGDILLSGVDATVLQYGYTVGKNDSILVAFNPRISSSISYLGTPVDVEIIGDMLPYYGSTHSYIISVGTNDYGPFSVLVSNSQGVEDVTTSLTQINDLQWELVLENISENTNIDVVIRKMIINITTEVADGEGTITPGETFAYDPEYVFEYEIEADVEAGFRIAYITLDNVRLSGITPGLEYYSGAIPAPIDEDHVLKAYFGDMSIIYTVYSGRGYLEDFSELIDVTTEPSVTQVWLASGSAHHAYFRPDIGYKIAKVLINGQLLNNIDEYLFADVREAQYIDIYFEKETYTITTEAYGYGEITAGETFLYADDYTYNYTISPDEGYEISSILINNEEATITDPDGMSCQLVAPSQNYLIQAFFTGKTYNVTATANEGGTVAPYGTTTYNWHASPEYIVTAAEGYAISEILLDGVAQTITDYQTWSIAFTEIEADHEIEVAFTQHIYTIEVTQGSNGTIAPETMTVPHNASPTFTITPADNYHVSSVTVNGIDKGAITEYTFINVAADQTITASFAINEYNVTAACGDGGTITASNTFIGGTSPAYTVTPNTGYRIASVAVDGFELPIANPNSAYTHTFTNISADHIIYATFTQRTYTITATQPANGIISPAGVSTLLHGGANTYTITPNEGYNITAITVNGSNIPNLSNYIDAYGVATYTISNVTSNTTITATMAKRTFTITVTQGSNGTIAPSTATGVEYGTDRTFTITPAANYEIVSVIVDGIAVLPTSSYTFVHVDANHTITAEYALIPCEVPDNLFVTNLGVSSAVLNWSNLGVSSYKVEYKTLAAATYTPVNANNNQHTLSNLLEGTTYMWRVKAICGTGYESEWSDHSTFTTFVTPPSGITDADLAKINVYANLNHVNIVNETGVEIIQVDIYDVYGRHIYNGNVLESRETITLSVTNGNYIVKLITDKGIATYKVPIIW